MDVINLMELGVDLLMMDRFNQILRYMKKQTSYSNTYFKLYNLSTGNEGVHYKDSSNLKRKSSLIQDNDELDDSDYEEVKG